MAVEPCFFETPGAWRAWLAEHHADRDELWVGLYRKETGRRSITWPELVEEALCFGWIDGIRKGRDAESYVIRVTPRRPRSVWSAVNIARARELIELGRMQPAGQRAFEARRGDRSAIYSYERRHGAAALAPEEERAFREQAAAWADFERRSPSYRRAAVHWVVSAKRADTRARRLAQLIEASAAGERIPPLR